MYYGVFMVEKEVSFKSSGFTLHGVLHIPKKPTRNAVIFANGFPDNYLDYHLPITAARSFCENGFAALRFNPRGRYPSNGSLLKHGGIMSQAKDTENAIRFLKKQGFKNIGLVGHSFGGAASIAADKRYVSAIVLWDPSHPSPLNKFYNKKPIISAINKQGYYMDKRGESLIGTAFVKETHAFDKVWRNKLSDKKMPPVLFITGSKSILLKYVDEYYNIVKSSKSLKVIKDAKHTFDNHEHEKILLKETAAWLKRYAT